jgi:hypothetical protein
MQEFKTGGGGSEASRQALEEYEVSRPARVKKVKGQSIQEQSIVYTEESTAAYVAARMPAIYGALNRVLSEAGFITFCTNWKMALTK